MLILTSYAHIVLGLLQHSEKIIIISMSKASRIEISWKSKTISPVALVMFFFVHHLHYPSFMLHFHHPHYNNDIIISFALVLLLSINSPSSTVVCCCAAIAKLLTCYPRVYSVLISLLLQLLHCWLIVITCLLIVTYGCNTVTMIRNLAKTVTSQLALVIHWLQLRNYYLRFPCWIE